jgi:hypothetical protein
MMFESFYRQRLETDLARWQTDGVIAPSVADAIRAALPPRPKSITLATVIGIVGGLLIAAAFLAFVAANWSGIARPARLAILLAGIALAFGLGGTFDRRQRTHLADLAVAVGSIIFGAAIALVGQMYHLGADFAGGFLLWAIGALAAALLASSRGALAVALVAACLWSGANVASIADVPHWPFVVLWLACAVLAAMWNAPSARHLVALSALTWWTISAVGAFGFRHEGDAWFVFGAGSAVMLGGGLLLARVGPNSLRVLGSTLSIYGAFALAVAAATTPFTLKPSAHLDLAPWAVASAVAGLVLASAAAGLTRRTATALAALAIAFTLVPLAGLIPVDEPWLAYALTLLAMLGLLVAGALEEVRPRLVAGWIGIGSVIAAITWMVEGSLLRRAAFLAVAGIAAIGLAAALGRLTHGDRRQ